MKIKAALKHPGTKGSEGYFNLYDEFNHYLFSVNVSDASDLAWSIQMQIQAEQEPLSTEEEELADNARREAMNGAAQ